MQPRIGITVDNRDNSAASGQYEAAVAYSEAVHEAGGLPVLLPHVPDRAPAYLTLCDGLILTGGGDPDMTAFGEPTDPRARVIDPDRQAFELGLLHAAMDEPDKPILGICLGMQLMCLDAGGQLDQYLPQSLGDEAAAVHQDDRPHTLQIQACDSVLVAGPGLDACGLGSDGLDGPRDQGSEGSERGQATDQPATRSPDSTKSQTQSPESEVLTVVSSHRQAIVDPGSMRTVATSPDGLIEAVDDPHRRFFLGVQWHPERGRHHASEALSLGLIARFVAASRCAR
jgi:putative glutamine amidotransferase